MPQTPDSLPGTRIDEAIQLLDRIAEPAPNDAGTMQRVGRSVVVDVVDGIGGIRVVRTLGAICTVGGDLIVTTNSTVVTLTT